MMKKVCFQVKDSFFKEWCDIALDTNTYPKRTADKGKNMRAFYFNRRFLFAW
jgi:hypothetical protein